MYGSWWPRGVVKRVALKAGLTTPIEQITLAWLKFHGLKHHGLTLENGIKKIVGRKAQFRNRFYLARKRNIRFFAEDEWEKAIKLAYICDVVFLVDQPYNRPDADSGRKVEELPANIIRIYSWDEIYRQIRKFS